MTLLARLRTELVVTGTGQVIMGVGGVAGALARGVHVGRALVPFAIGLLIALGVTAASFGTIRKAAESAPAAPVDAEIEDGDRTARRLSLPLLVVAGAVAISVGIAGALGALVGGVAAGIGIVELVAARWSVRYASRQGVELLREARVFLLATARRPIYTRPTSASTLAT
jgi:hypothetical protein